MAPPKLRRLDSSQIHFDLPIHEARRSVRGLLRNPLAAALVVSSTASVRPQVAGVMIGTFLRARPYAANMHPNRALFQLRLRGRLRISPTGGCELRYRIVRGAGTPFIVVLAGCSLLMLVAAATSRSVVLLYGAGGLALGAALFALLGWAFRSESATEEALLGGWLERVQDLGRGSSS